MYMMAGHQGCLLPQHVPLLEALDGKDALASPLPRIQPHLHSPSPQPPAVVSTASAGLGPVVQTWHLVAPGVVYATPLLLLCGSWPASAVPAGNK